MNHPILFVSLGPGEAELITVKGLKKLQQSDCIYCPSTSNKQGEQRSRSAEILLALDIPQSKIELFDVPMSKDRTEAHSSYDKIYEKATLQYEENKRVVIVAEGDAGFYSSIHYICDKFVAKGIPTERVAGIPAFIAAGTLAGLHIVKQEEELLIIPGKTSSLYLQQCLLSGKTVVIMKLSQCKEEVYKCMDLTPQSAYHYFENVGTEDEFYTNNRKEIRERQFPYFSLMIIK